MIGNLIGRIAMADKMSVSQLEEALQNKTLPAYIAIPLIDEKTSMAQRMQAAQAAQASQQGIDNPISDEVLAKARAAQGIESLPTNMGMQGAEGMAGGGIVAFEDGGEIRFQNQGLVPSSVGFNLPMGTGKVDPQVLRALYVSQGKPLPPELMTEEEKKRARFTKQLDEPYPAGVFPKVGRFFSNVGTAAEGAMTGGLGFNYYSEPDADSTPAAPTAPKPDARIPDTATAPAASNAPTAPAAPTGIAALPAAQLPATPDFSKGSAEVKGYLQDYLGRSEEREKRLMESIGQNRLQGKAFESYEQQLRAEAEKAGMDKEEARSMALVKAGLAMMAGTSQHALENIGKGAMVGVQDYQAASKDLKKAERERMKEFTFIEQARRAEEQNDLNRRDNLLMRASDAAQRRDDFGTKAMMDLGIKDQEQALRVWDTQYRVAGQLQGASVRQRPGITPYQLAQLRDKASKKVDPMQVRGVVASQLKLKNPPKPGEDASFDRKVEAAYEAALEKEVNLLLGGVQSSANSLQGFRLVTDEE